MRNLEKLDFLNGLKVERDILNEESSVGGTETDELNHQSQENRQLNVDTQAKQIIERRGTGQSRKGGLQPPANQIYTIHSESHREDEDDSTSIKNRNPLITGGDDTNRSGQHYQPPAQVENQSRRASNRSNQTSQHNNPNIDDEVYQIL
jgi:hypothetical protein